MLDSTIFKKLYLTFFRIVFSHRVHTHRGLDACLRCWSCIGTLDVAIGSGINITIGRGTLSLTLVSDYASSLLWICAVELASILTIRTILVNQAFITGPFSLLLCVSMQMLVRYHVNKTSYSLAMRGHFLCPFFNDVFFCMTKRMITKQK